MDTNWMMAKQLVKDMEMALRDYLENTPAAHIPAVQLHILNSLYEKDGQNASELASSVGLAATSFTPILDWLQDAGLILRRPDPNDRRGVRIYLTANGEELKPHITKAFARLGSGYIGQVKKPDGTLIKFVNPV